VARFYNLVSYGYKPMMVLADDLYKVQVDAFRNRAGAETREAELKTKGYDTFITQKAGVPISMSA
jgi:cell division septation protein DedD